MLASPRGGQIPRCFAANPNITVTPWRSSLFHMQAYVAGQWAAAFLEISRSLFSLATSRLRLRSASSSAFNAPCRERHLGRLTQIPEPICAEPLNAHPNLWPLAPHLHRTSSQAVPPRACIHGCKSVLSLLFSNHVNTLSRWPRYRQQLRSTEFRFSARVWINRKAESSADQRSVGAWRYLSL